MCARPARAPARSTWLLYLQHPALLPLSAQRSPPPLASYRLTALPFCASLPPLCCLPVQVACNPCLSYAQHIVLPWCEKLEVERAEANGGNK